MKVAKGLSTGAEACPLDGGICPHGWPEGPVAMSITGAISSRVCAHAWGWGTGICEPRQMPQAAGTCPQTGSDSVTCWCCIYFWLHYHFCCKQLVGRYLGLPSPLLPASLQAGWHWLQSGAKIPANSNKDPAMTLGAPPNALSFALFFMVSLPPA